jgi:exopolysaccharide biosynthesis polyprenyl glycosylphosphotransferase
MFEEREKELKWKMLGWDCAIAAAALMAAFWLRIALPGGDVGIDPLAHFSLLPVFLILMLFSLSYHGAYLSPINASFLEFTWSISRGLLMAIAGLLAIMFAMRIRYFSRGVLGLFSFMLFSGILSLRFYYIWMLNRSFRDQNNLYKVLIIGTGNRAIQLVKALRKNTARGIDIIGYIDPYTNKADVHLPESCVLGTTADIRAIFKCHVIDEVIIAITRSMFEDVEEIVHVCEQEGIKFRIMADFFDLQIARVSLGKIGDIPLLTLEPVALDESKLVVKRLIDFAFSTICIVILLPLMAVVALAIKIDSKGPVFFVQERVGFRKRHFKMIKFRSMFDGSDAKIEELENLNEAEGPIFKIANDPRITFVGRFLRQSSLDELPQLFNILKGEMSLVGPRPMSVRDVELFDQSIQRKRFSVKPGLTCLWQVSGRSNLPFSKWLELDLDYIDHWNLILDFKILLKTIPAVLSGEGAE